MLESFDNQFNNKLGLQSETAPVVDSVSSSEEISPDFSDLDEMHAVPVENETSNFDKKRKEISSKLSPIAYVASSVYHVLTG